MHSDLVFQPAKGRSVIVRIAKGEKIEPFLILDEKIVPSYSLLPLSTNLLIYLDTTQGEVLEINSKTGQILKSTKITDGFLRGVTLIDEDTLVLGSNNELIVFDLIRRSIQSKMQITDIPQESIFDIQVLPSNYELPPNSLGESGFRD